MIAFDYGAVRDGRPVTSYVNINKFISKGVTIDQRVNVGDLEVGAGFGYSGRFHKLDDTDDPNVKFYWSPEVNGNVSYEFKPISLITTLYYKYSGRLQLYREGVLETQEDFHVADLSLRKSLGNNLTLTAGARNIFNVSALRSGSTTGGVHTNNASLGMYGRSYFLSLNFQLSK